MKKKIKINLGCGVHVVKGFINVDKFFSLKDLKSKKGLYSGATIDKGGEFIQADMKKLPFKDNYADYIETFDSIEHVGKDNVLSVLKEIYRVLKPGGKLCLMTTNFDQLAEAWVKYIKGKPFNAKTAPVYMDLQEIIYGNQIGPGEFHNVAFNPHFLGFVLTLGGFEPKNIVMTLYPMGSPEHPPAKTIKAKKGTVHRSEMIWVEAIK